MPVLIGPALVVTALLTLAGAQKLVDPATTVGALRALRLPSSSGLVRAGSAAELALGVATVIVGGPVLWSLVAISYVAFSAFVVAALRQGTMLGSCGCFGREDTPPHPSHVVLNLLLAAMAAGSAASLDAPVVDELAAHPGAAAAVLAIALVALYLLHAAYVELPRTLAAGNALRSGAID